MGLFRGKDGQWYDTVDQMIAADNRYEQQETQNKLLEEQNKLLQQQALLEQERQARQRELELAQRNKEIKAKQQAEEQRLLSLCDAVGINKPIIDNYIKYIFSDELVNEEDRKKLKKYNQSQEDLQKDRKNLWEDERTLHNLEIIKEIKNNDFSHIDDMELYYGSNLKHLVEEYDSSSDLIIGGIGTTVVMVIIITVAMGIFLDWWTWGPTILGLIPLFYYIFMMFGQSAKKNEIQKLCDSEIKRLKKSLHNKNKTLTEEIIDNKMDEIYDKHLVIMQKNVKNKIEALNEFRLNHYNYKIDKLLLDMGLDNRLKNYKLKYKIISKEEALATGDIDDYVIFFTKESEKYN